MANQINSWINDTSLDCRSRFVSSVYDYFSKFTKWRAVYSWIVYRHFCSFFTIYWPFRLLYLCLTTRIISALILLHPKEINNAQIECFATNKIRESKGKPIRKLRIVSYASTCPLCSSRIEVENGGKEFHHRFIGR